MASQWRHIGLYGHSVGTFALSDDALQWKSGSTSKIAPAKAITRANFSVFGPTGHLVVQVSSEKDKGNKGDKYELHFDGFRPTDYDKIKDIFERMYNIELERKSFCSSGASFGVSDIQDGKLTFFESLIVPDEDDPDVPTETTGEQIMSFDLKEVSQCVLPGNNRNEIELQFHESDATMEAGTDQLVHIRFYVPPDADADMQDRDTLTPAEHLQKRIMESAQIKSTTGEIIAEFSEHQGTFLTPRGRYNIELYDSYLRLRGAKYDYRIKFDDISRLFLLPRPDDIHLAFVIALDKPVRQGQQRYQYLILQTTRETSQVTINLDEDVIAKDYGGELQPVMNGALSNLIAKTFKIITRKKVFVPGKFTTAGSAKCVKCALKANEGHLYPLEKQFIFIHKPALLIRFEEVESVEFQRYAGGAGSTRNFDLCITLKQGIDGSKEYVFSGIDRSDYNSLYSFLSNKKIRIKNLKENAAEEKAARVPVYNEDEIFGVTPRGDGEEESSEDEDYDAVAQASSESSSEMSDDDDGVDSGSDSDLEDARRAAQKAAKKEKNARKRSGDGDGSVKKKVKSSASPKAETTKGKKKKDPNAPKRGLSSYMIFMKKKRDEIKDANPDASFGEIGKLIGAAFKALGEEERKKYDDMAAVDKERYIREQAAYKASLPSDASDDDDDNATTASSKKSRKKKDKNAPKRGLTSYMLFAKEKREGIKEANPDASFGELGKLVGAAFKALTADEKKKYEDLAAVDKERYARDMKEYKDKLAAAANASDGDNDEDSD